MSTGIPVIDIGPLTDGGMEGLTRVARAVGKACRETGFFYIVNHGLPTDLRERVFAAAATFFASDASVKEACSIRRSPHNRGYVGLSIEALDPARGPDLKEAFNAGLDLPPNDPAVVAGASFRGFNLWPDLPDFRDTVLAYYDAAWLLGRRLHRAVAVDLGLRPDAFEPMLDRPMATLRLLHYPASLPGKAAPIGAGEHTDYGNLTLLATDEVGGLEVRSRDGRWIEAPVVPHALICNIGDCLMRWTNDVYASTPHRVVNASGRERYSVAFFLDPNPDAVVACLPTCTGPDRPPKYPPVLAAAYLQSRLDATYRGTVPADRLTSS